MVAAAAATNVRQQQYGLIVARLRSSANNYHGTDCRARMNDKMIFSTMLLSYRYLYMRTRGHEVLSQSSATQPISAPANERNKSRLLWQRLAIRHPKSNPRIVQLFPPKAIWMERHFPFSPISPPFLFPFLSLPFPMTNFSPSRFREGSRRLSRRSIPTQQKQ